MMGHRRFAPRLYYQLSLDRLVPSGHLLRHIAEVIDFSFVYPLARPYYSHTGQPSVDPVVLFKALLVGYLYGITSERRLMDEIQVNLAYRWFLGYDLDEATPNGTVAEGVLGAREEAVGGQQCCTERIEEFRAEQLWPRWPPEPFPPAPALPS